MMDKIYTTTAKLPKSINQTMLEKIVKDGYGLRGKSKWICEAIQEFLKLDNYPELTEIADDMETMDAIVSMRINEKLMKAIDKATVEVRKKYPSIEGVKSKIIRASIIQRFIRS